MRRLLMARTHFDAYSLLVEYVDLHCATWDEAETVLPLVHAELRELGFCIPDLFEDRHERGSGSSEGDEAEASPR